MSDLSTNSSSAAEPLEHWVFGIRLEDRPGALSAVTNVFSQRGISLRTTVAGAGGLWTGASPTVSSQAAVNVVLSFEATSRRRMHLQRLVERLAVVQDVQAFRYDSARLRAVVMARLLGVPAMVQTPPLVESLRLEIIAQTSDSVIVMVSGSPRTVDEWLVHWSAAGQLAESVKAIMVV